MWLFTSKGRPQAIRRVVDTYAWGGESKVLLTLYDKDEKIDEYLNQTWPDNFTIELVDVLGNGPTYNEILRRFPNERCYGFLADDAVLRVPGMLKTLEDAAGNWNVAYANDQHHGEAICTMPCLGGDLVRAVGYLSPKWIVHAAIDCAWHEIGARLGCLKYFPELIYDHLHPLFGTAEMDKTYRDAAKASFAYHDVLRSWMLNGQLDAAVTSVTRAMAQRKAA